MKAWADANPELAAKERTRLGAFTQEEIEEKSKPKANSLQRMQPSLGAMEGSVSAQMQVLTLECDKSECKIYNQIAQPASRKKQVKEQSSS